MRSQSPIALIVSLGILSSAGAASSSMSIVMGALSPRLPEKKRTVTIGIINAGEASGQFIYPPLIQALISLRGYTGAFGFLAGMALVAIIPAWFLFGKVPARQKTALPADAKSEKPPAVKGEFSSQLVTALKDLSYLMVLAEFFTCGFRIVLFSTHLPGEINFYGLSPQTAALCFSIIGICNIAGTLSSGILGKYFRLKYLLSVIYTIRFMLLIAFLCMPKTAVSFYLFAVGIGLTWNATVPPTIGLIGKLFTGRFLAIFIGIAFFTHQIGAFLGAWLGGLVRNQTGNLMWMWYVALGLALFGALIVLPIREKK
jgi:predicted MFS family arabinose efflux permease